MCQRIIIHRIFTVTESSKLCSESLVFKPSVSCCSNSTVDLFVQVKAMAFKAELKVVHLRLKTGLHVVYEINYS